MRGKVVSTFRVPLVWFFSVPFFISKHWRVCMYGIARGDGRDTDKDPRVAINKIIQD